VASREKSSSKRKNPGVVAVSPSGGAVLAALPPSYRTAPRWARRHLAILIAGALADGYGPEAIVAAATRAPAGADDHVPALRAALRGLRADVLGGACTDCGQHPDDGPLRHVCDRCHPDSDILSDADQAALVRLRDDLALDVQRGNARDATVVVAAAGA
jgi:hypothetical protein